MEREATEFLSFLNQIYDTWYYSGFNHLGLLIIFKQHNEIGFPCKLCETFVENIGWLKHCNFCGVNLKSTMKMLETVFYL